MNTANGTEALYNNTTAWFNTAMGSQALFNNTTGLSNTANGYQALYLATKPAAPTRLLVFKRSIAQPAGATSPWAFKPV